MKRAFTLIELLVVVLILGLLATIAVGVFTTQVERARYAAAKSTISSIELAVNRYHIDLGVYPPSGSGYDNRQGCGWLQFALMHSMSGNSKDPASKQWKGPYLTVRKELLGDSNGTPLEELQTQPIPQDVQILDPWHSPYRYVRSGPEPDDYAQNQGTLLPTSHPYFASERYYNASTFQVASKGLDGETPDFPNYGTGLDDVTNFGM